LDATTSISSILSAFSAKIGKSFTPTIGEEAVMLIGGEIKSVKLSQSLIVGVPCSSIDEIELYISGCKVTLKEIADLGKTKLMCAEDCSTSS